MTFPPLLCQNTNGCFSKEISGSYKHQIPDQNPQTGTDGIFHKIHFYHPCRNRNDRTHHRKQFTHKHSHTSLFPKHVDLTLHCFLLFRKFPEIKAQHLISACSSQPIQRPASCQSGRHRQYHDQRKTDFTLRCPDPGKRHDHPRRKSRKIQIFQKHDQKDEKCSIFKKIICQCVS